MKAKKLIGCLLSASIVLSSASALAMETWEFEQGMAKGIEYFNKGMYYEACDEFQWFCDFNWGLMNVDQQQYALDYLDGTKAKIQQLNSNGQVAKVWNDMGWVYETYNDSRYYYGDGNSNYFSYKIPCFNINSPDSRTVNNIINGDIHAVINDEYNSMKHGYSLYIYSTDYFVQEHDDLVSLVTVIDYDNDYQEYSAYTMDLKTGKRITNYDLINRTGYTQSQFLERVKMLMLNKFESIYKDMIYGSFSSDYWWYYNYTSSTELCNLDIPMYVGANRHLYIIPNIGSMAGASSYPYIIDTGVTVW